jgi:hypothetical protein
MSDFRTISRARDLALFAARKMRSASEEQLRWVADQVERMDEPSKTAFEEMYERLTGLKPRHTLRMRSNPLAGRGRGRSSMYERFHGHGPRRAPKGFTLEIPGESDPMVFLGDKLTITYRSDKLNGGGDGRLAHYRHVFDKTTKLYASPDGKWLMIRGPKMIVSNRGIVN